jgi:multiple sugar transport system permease protein
MSVKVKRGTSYSKYGYLFVAPLVIGTLAFILYPIFNMIWLSFRNTQLLTGRNDFVGISNYTRLLGDANVRDSIFITWKIWLWNFIPQLASALVLSVWFTSLRLKVRGVGVWRAIFYLPNLLMPATIAVMCAELLGYAGPINQILVRSGLIETAINFARSPTYMQGTVAFVQWWMWFGHTVIIIMAGLSSISPSLYESAYVDGASGPRIFFKITLPLLKPIMLYILVTSLVGGMQMFDVPFVMTDGRGAPMGSLATMNIRMMNFYESQGRPVGYAAAMGMIIFIITVSVSVVINLLLRKRNDDMVPKRRRRGGTA